MEEFCAARFGDSIAFTAEKAPTTNGCFEVSAALPGASPWPPPPVTAKAEAYTPVVGTLLWSKFNGDRRLAGPTVDEEMASLGDLVDLMTEVSEADFTAAAAAAAAARLEANKPKNKKASATLKALGDKIWGKQEEKGGAS